MKLSTEPTIDLGEVRVVNRHHYRHGADRELVNYEYIGRPHLMSNPFTVKEYGLDRCMDLFNGHLRQRIQSSHPETMEWLKCKAELIIAGENVHLGCSCKRNRPEDIPFLADPDVPCHGDTVALAIEWMAYRAYKVTENSTSDKAEKLPINRNQPELPNLSEGQPRYAPFRRGDRVCLRFAQSKTYEVLTVVYAPYSVNDIPTPHLIAPKAESDVNFLYTLKPTGDTGNSSHTAYWYHSQLQPLVG